MGYGQGSGSGPGPGSGPGSGSGSGSGLLAVVYGIAESVAVWLPAVVTQLFARMEPAVCVCVLRSHGAVVSCLLGGGGGGLVERDAALLVAVCEGVAYCEK